MNTANNNIEDMKELEALRAQVAQFKARLDEQEIVNDRLLRNAVNGKVNRLRKYSNTVYILGAIGYLMIFAAFVAAKVNLMPVIILAVMCLAEFIFCSWNLKQIAGVSQMKVVDAQTAIAKYTKREKWLNICEFIPVLALVIWGVSEFHPDQSRVIEMIIVGIIMVIVCAVIIGKQFKMVAEVRKSIEELRKDEYSID